MNTLKLENLPIESINLTVPSLQDLVEALLYDGLTKNFAEVDVRIVDCPDLTLPPFNLAAKGLGGNPCVIQIGDSSYVIPVTSKEKLYDFKDVSKILNMKSAFMIGAGAADWCLKDNLLELYINLTITQSNIQNFSKYAFTEDRTLNSLSVETVDICSSRFALLANLYVSRGEPGKVIRISCKRRIGIENFTSAIISSLKTVFNYPIALGIVFEMSRGKAEHHVPPYFAEGIKTASQLHKWLLLPKISAPFTSIGTLITSNPPGWDINLQHIHSCNNRELGHYHFDVTPEEVEYVAYVTPAEKLYAIDRNLNRNSAYLDLKAELNLGQ